VDDTPTAPLALSAAPNPFNPQTRITFTMPAPGPARLSVYDVAGRRVATLVDGPVGAGASTVTWRGVADDGRPVASGVYFARLEADGAQVVYKLVITK
jgi:flagellar hook assembly protein FlgD